MISLSIICLILNNILPIFASTNYESTGKTIYLNMHSIQNFNNPNIGNIIANMGNINLLLWAVIFLSIISLFGVTLYPSKRYGKISKIFLYAGFPLLFLNILNLILFLSLSNHVINLNNFLLSYAFDPFRYSYLPTILLIFLLLFSIVYFYILIKLLLAEIKEKKIEKEKIHKKIESRNIQKKETKKENISDLKLVLSNKKEENRSNDSTKIESKKDYEKVDTVDTSKKQPADIDINVKEEKSKEIEFDKKIEQPIEKEEKVEKINKPENKISNRTKDTSIFKEKLKEKKEENETEIKKPEKSLEKALDNAIKKRKGEPKNIKKDEDNQKQNKSEGKKPINEKKEGNEVKKAEEKSNKDFQVKCPQCSNVFNIKKVEGINKIKCPKCGKEGIIKL